MRRTGDRYECTLCGVLLDGVSEQTRVRSMLVQASGTAKLRALLADGQEVHRCQVAPAGNAESPGQVDS